MTLATLALLALASPMSAQQNTQADSVEQAKIKELLRQYDTVAPDGASHYKVSKDGRWGIADETGKDVVQCLFDDVSSLAPNGWAWIKENGMYGLYDVALDMEIQVCKFQDAYTLQNGKRVPVDFSQAPSWANGPIYVKKGGFWGVMTSDAKMTVPCLYDFVSAFDNDRAWVRYGNKYGIITSDGTTVQNCSFSKVEYHTATTDFVFNGDNVLVDFTKGKPYVTAHGRIGILNPDGTTCSPFVYDSIGHYTEGMVMVKAEGQYGFLDEDGRYAIQCIYSQASNFSEGIAAVKRPNKDVFLFISRDGRVLFEHKADEVGAFKEGLCLVTKKDQQYYITTDGKKVK